MCSYSKWMLYVKMHTSRWKFRLELSIKQRRFQFILFEFLISCRNPMKTGIVCCVATKTSSRFPGQYKFGLRQVFLRLDQLDSFNSRTDTRAETKRDKTHGNYWAAVNVGGLDWGVFLVKNDRAKHPVGAGSVRRYKGSFLPPWRDPKKCRASK